MTWHYPAATAYCGPPPTPDSVTWNLDPILIGGLLAVAGAYWYGRRQLERTGPKLGFAEKAGFYAGWLIAALALVSPLCPLSVSLFAARVGQHMILTLLAAPLLVVGRTPEALAAGFGRAAPSRNRTYPGPLPASAWFAVLLWFWHAPVPYAATFSSTAVYWSMHLSVFGAALWLWHGLLAGAGKSVITKLAGGFASSAQMGLLGALITLAPRAVYAPHALTTAAWGLTRLEDQQLGGIVMWIPGCLIFLAFAMLALTPALTETKPPQAYRSV